MQSLPAVVLKTFTFTNFAMGLFPYVGTILPQYPDYPKSAYHLSPAYDGSNHEGAVSLSG